jgi:hypothetical protein
MSMGAAGTGLVMEVAKFKIAIGIWIVRYMFLVLGASPHAPCLQVEQAKWLLGAGACSSKNRFEDRPTYFHRFTKR